MPPLQPQDPRSFYSPPHPTIPFHSQPFLAGDKLPQKSPSQAPPYTPQPPSIQDHEKETLQKEIRKLQQQQQNRDKKIKQLEDIVDDLSHKIKNSEESSETQRRYHNLKSDAPSQEDTNNLRSPALQKQKELQQPQAPDKSYAQALQKQKELEQPQAPDKSYAPALQKQKELQQPQAPDKSYAPALQKQKELQQPQAPDKSYAQALQGQGRKKNAVSSTACKKVPSRKKTPSEKKPNENLPPTTQQRTDEKNLCLCVKKNGKNLRTKINKKPKTFKQQTLSTKNLFRMKKKKIMPSLTTINIQMSLPQFPNTLGLHLSL